MTTTAPPDQTISSYLDDRASPGMAGSPRARPAGAVAPRPASSRLTQLVRGTDDDPPWARPALLLLLAATAALYLWDLGASSTANSFYAAAVQAGTKSWKAMFFGSLDWNNVITVDKPAVFMWPMEIAGRLFGFNSWSMLVPQALEGVLAVGLLAATVRRTSGHAAGLLAGFALAVTPVAALMFRFNNPDAMLTLLLVGAGYAVVRALQNGSTKWLLVAGACIGTGFITKMGQALLIVPALGLAYLVAAPTPIVRRLLQLLAAGVAMVLSAGWYVAAVDLWPAASRPYIGGSTTNSLLELALGYNGLGRLFGNTAGNGGGGGGGFGGAGGGFGGPTGITRLFSSDMATEASWLLPTALLALVVGLWLTRRAPRTDLRRAALILFGGWLLVTGGVFSFMQGTIHPYYLIALAPGIVGVVAVTARELWITRAIAVSRLAAVVLVAVTAAWDAHLLGLTTTFLPALRYVLVAAAVVAAIGLMATPWLRSGRRGATALAAVLAAVCLAGLGGTAAYALDTASQPHTGSMPSAGPAGTAGSGGSFGARTGGTRPAGLGAATGQPAGRTAGGPGGGEQANAQVVALLKATTTRWAAAATGSMSAAPLQLASGTAVMSIGGFNGGDPAPTLAQFQQYVAAGQVRYFIGGGGFGGGGGNGSGSQISSWVASHYKAITVGGQTVYDLSAPTS